MKTALVSPSSTSQKYSNEELERHLGERRRGDDQHQRAEQAADHGEHQARAERELSAWPLRVIA